MSTSIMTSPGSGGTDEPPGITALSRRPPRPPPASARRSRNGVPSGTSKFPGRLTCPDTEKHFTPPLFGRPRAMRSGPRLLDGAISVLRPRGFACFTLPWAMSRCQHTPRRVSCDPDPDGGARHCRTGSSGPVPREPRPRELKQTLIPAYNDYVRAWSNAGGRGKAGRSGKGAGRKRTPRRNGSKHRRLESRSGQGACSRSIRSKDEERQRWKSSSESTGKPH